MRRVNSKPEQKSSSSFDRDLATYLPSQLSPTPAAQINMAQTTLVPRTQITQAELDQWVGQLWWNYVLSGKSNCDSSALTDGIR